MTVEAYPLCWPVGRTRTERPERARFETRFAVARDRLIDAIRMLGGRDVIISTNVPVRRDGWPYAARRSPDDPGVAVYFTYRKKQHCFACDKWQTVRDNTQAIYKTIEAIRGIARWGTGDMMERAFSGFAALPDPMKDSPWHEVLCVDPGAGLPQVQRAYRIAASQSHPDMGGSAEQFNRVHRAWKQYRAETARTAN